MNINKVKEFLKLVPKGILHADKVVEGIINNVKFNNGSLSEEEQDEIVKRRLICMTCPFNSINARESEEYKNLYNGQTYKTERQDLHCSHCACNIDWKTASLSEKCGLSYYNDLNPNNKQELLWEKFEKND